ncbi:MAG TPA: DUF1992 domain-containing protein [Pseudonocardiaceae bacterium]|nr:DUF1992 domain-containing protein [Pseudonocardiaceae bacterium]
MTERKPAGVSFESWVDAQVRAAQERGAFDNLPGTGKPIPGIDEPYDEDWWVKRKLREEEGSAELLLPTSLRLRKEIEALPETVRALAAERLVREAVAELNERIVAWLRSPTPPHVPLRRVDADEVVARWRRATGRSR